MDAKELARRLQKRVDELEARVTNLEQDCVRKPKGLRAVGPSEVKPVGPTLNKADGETPEPPGGGGPGEER